MINYLKIYKSDNESQPVIINFNEDLTFLVGRNGAGKTTVLNIISSIATGNFSDLLRFHFSLLEMEYNDKQGDKQLLIIILKESKMSLKCKGISETVDIRTFQHFKSNRYRR